MANWDGAPYDMPLTQVAGLTVPANPIGTKTTGVLWPRAIRGVQK